MEEFKHLLDPTLVALMQESMYNATIADGYRVGGVDGDNYELFSSDTVCSSNFQCIRYTAILGTCE
ncbi:hypothetical protein C8J56DRAFT_65909 [Mycena floridula]|nr:hypothetical protein C8J56DRAFT_65909 [Mycena floridula]